MCRATPGNGITLGAPSCPPCAEPLPEGARPMGLFREIGAATAWWWQWAQRYCQYYAWAVWDAVRNAPPVRALFSPARM